MRPAASLILAGTLLASGLAILLSGPGQTLEWRELCSIGGGVGTALTAHAYWRWLAGRDRITGLPAPALSLFWKAIAALALFGFWFCATFFANTALSLHGPIERIDGSVSGKRVSKGRYGDSHVAAISSARGMVESSLPRDVWLGLHQGQRVTLLVCHGLLGFPYVVTPLSRDPVIDLRRLPGFRHDGRELRC